MPRDEFRTFADSQTVVHFVLVVEDDPEQAAAVKALLEANGYKVSIAKDGGQAQSAFVMRHPDFVVLDLILPGESGFEICERFKQTNDSIPVLVVSAIDLPDARALAERVGADGYLTKPYKPEALLSHIKDIAQFNWQRTHGDRPANPESDRIRFKCPGCRKRFKVNTAHRGRTLTCPDCGEPMSVPMR